jgi:uncharacterized protein
MIEVKIDSIRVSLMSQHRVVVLKELDTDRYLPIWIGPFEADAITIQLQGVKVARPLTHDLLQSVIQKMGAKISHVLVSDLRNDTYYARIVVDIDGNSMEIDSRPSDAIALAVRAGAPLFVDEGVMEAASVTPEAELKLDDIEDTHPATIEEEKEEGEAEDLSAFSDFVKSLDLDDLDEGES